MLIDWKKEQVTLLPNHTHNTGRIRDIGDILFSDFSASLPEIIALRNLDRECETYSQAKLALKAKTQCCTISAALHSRAKGDLQIKSRTHLMQLDFDKKDICDYDIEELKQAVFSLPFIAFCSLSCSGEGFYALAVISEPDRLADYAEHCFEVLKGYGINPDESKGKKIENLRYVSYDANMLIRDNPEPLVIKNYKRKQKPQQTTPIRQTVHPHKSNSPLINKKITEVINVTEGNRWATVQNVAYTLGGLNDHSILTLINYAIYSNSEFAGVEAKYLKCAKDCFNEGLCKPLTPISQ